MKRWLLLSALVTLSAGGCRIGGDDESSAVSSSDLSGFAGGVPFPEADALFRTDARWLGGDAVYSVDLGSERTLWLFGDSFIATSLSFSRSESKMVRNTVGLQRGSFTKGTLEFRWATGADGLPSSFFEERGADWHWPQHGARIGAAGSASGPLVLFFSVLHPTPGVGFGFAHAGWQIARVDNPDEPVSTWRHVWLDPPSSSFDAIVGSAVVRQGGYLVALAYRSEGAHAGYLVRFAEEALAAGRVEPEWWAGESRGWVLEHALAGLPAEIMDEAGSECSVHFDPRTNQWLHVTSRGFGATTIAARTAPALEGPWSAPSDLFTPPESKATNPFVYAGKAHPHFDAGDGSLVVTYAANAFDHRALFRPEGALLYWPRVVRLRR